MSSEIFLQWLSEFPIESADERKQILKGIKAWKIDKNSSLRDTICQVTEKYLKSGETLLKNTAVFLTNLIEDVDGFRSSFGSLVRLIINKIATSLKNRENETKADVTQKILRLALQILQSYKPQIHDLLLQCDVMLQDDFRVIGLTALTTIREDKTFIQVLFITFWLLEKQTRRCFVFLSLKHHHDASQMCGTILGFMLSYFKNPQISAESLHLLLHRSSETFEIKIMPTVTMNLDSNTMQPLPEIWLLLGILSCCKSEIMLCPIDGANAKLIHTVFDKIIFSCKSTDPVLQYHAFRALKLLWSKILKLSKQFVEIHPKFKQDGIHLQKSLTLVWENWDNPVSGVPELINNIFENILKVNANCENASLLSEIMCKQVLATSAFVKGKYVVLPTLIKFIGVEFFLANNSTFFNSIIPCLGKNHLAPVVSRVYQCCISGIKKSEQDTLTLWKKLFAPSLLQSLLHTSSTIQNNALHYWVPPNLKLHTEVFDELTRIIAAKRSQNLLQKQTFLLAMLGVIKCARCSGLRNFSTLDQNVLKVGITALNDKIRSNALSIVCISHRRSDSITDEEFAFVTEHLPLNLNSDSASFRNELLFSLSSFIQRVVTKLAACLKKDPQSVHIIKYVNFLKWIKQLCISSLGTTCSFQRKHTSLNLLALLLQTLDVSNTSKKKTILPQDLQLVVKTLQKNNLSLCTSDEAKCLINLLEDVVPEIRESAFKMLLQYFTKAILGPFSTKLEERCLVLLCSPKAQDAESGSLIAVFLVNVLWLPEHKEEVNHSSIFLSFILKLIVPNLRKQIVLLKTDYLKASYYTPVFGWLLALSKCCVSLQSQSSDSFTDNKDATDSLNKVLDEILSLLLHVMSKVFACTDENMEFIASADFQEMSARIMKIIEDCKQQHSKVTTANKDHVMLANDEEVVLACSWLIMKNGCNALASIGILLRNLTVNENDDQFFPIWKKISSCYLKILTSCRHRGIIESCAECLYSCCHNLFQSKICVLVNFVIGLVDEILVLFSLNTSSNEITGGTVTRRSAGLPLIVESVLSASIGTDFSHDLVVKTVETMAVCISDLLSEPHIKVHDNADIPAVHALYVLKHLFKNTILGGLMMIHATKFFELSLKCLSSHLWLVRNAATHLLGAISSRMLGQKHIESTDHTSVTNSLTLQEFFSWHPKLLHVMLSFLENDLEITQDEKKHFNVSAIYPIISILSKLSNTQDLSQNKKLQTLLDSLQRCLECPSFAIRKASAQAILGLQSVGNVVSLACGYLESLPSGQPGAPFQQICQNKLHGWLELIYCLFQQQKDNLRSNTSLQSLCEQILKIKWLGIFSINKCPYTAAQYIQTLNLITKSLPDVNIGMEMIQSLIDIVFSPKNFNFKQAGALLYLEELIHLILNTAEMTKIVLICEKFLDLHNPFVCTAVMQWISGITKSQSTLVSNKHAYEILNRVWTEPLGPSNSSKLECFVQMWPSVQANLTPQIYSAISTQLLQIHHGIKNLSTSCHLIPALSCLIEYDLVHEDVSDKMCYIQPWLEEVGKYTYSSKASEPLRFASAMGLSRVGANILWWMHKHVALPSTCEDELTKYTKVPAVIYKTAFYHLHDEQPEVREHASVFVAVLTKLVTVVPHPNVAITYLLADLQQHIPANHCVIEMLFEILMDLPSIAIPDNRAGVSLFQQEAFNLFVEPCEVAKTLDPIVKKFMEECPELTGQWIQKGFAKATKKLKHLSGCISLLGSKVWIENATCTVIYINNIVRAAIKHCVNLSLSDPNTHLRVIQQDAKADLAIHLSQYWKISKTLSCNQE